jgi:hypothetical protein
LKYVSHDREFSVNPNPGGIGKKGSNFFSQTVFVKQSVKLKNGYASQNVSCIFLFQALFDLFLFSA